MAHKNDIDLAVQAARKAFDSGKWTSMPNNERGKIIWKIGELIDEHNEEGHVTLTDFENYYRNVSATMRSHALPFYSASCPNLNAANRIRRTEKHGRARAFAFTSQRHTN